MIKSITAIGRYITVLGGTPGSTYINSYNTGQGIGNMRFNTATQNTEVWDGNSWMVLQTSYASVQLDPEAILLLDWAKEKRAKEIVLENLAKEHPAVKAAYENMKRSEEQLETTIILSKDEKTTS